MNNLADINIESYENIISPKEILEKIPASKKARETVLNSRKIIKDILEGKDNRIMIILGPCSIHNKEEAIEYAERLVELQEKVKDKFFLIMRAYFQKPRTTVGWKGLINDPHLDGSHDINNGLSEARKLLLDLAELGVPAVTEVLDPNTPQYIGDLISWAAIGARTTESQTHREMASGLSMPVGFKNATSGDISIAINAINSASSPHIFLGIDYNGKINKIKTKGNNFTHLILRGGKEPNYDKNSISKIKKTLSENNLEARIVVDCSHGNSGKDYKQQPNVFFDVIEQIKEGEEIIAGVMLESYLEEGNQKMPGLKKGVSVTDACISWETTEKIILEAHDKL